MVDLSELVTKLETATGPNYALDVEIAIALGYPQALTEPPPSFTGSLDAAVRMVENLGYQWLRKSPHVMTVYRQTSDDKTRAAHSDWRGVTPALSLCVAAFRALSERES